MISFRKDNIKKIQPDPKGQFQYLGRWVNKDNFRAFLYNERDEQKLANSYAEYESLIASGLWFASKPDASQKRKQKNVVCTDS